MTVKNNPFFIRAWGIHTSHKLLITCDSRASAEDLLDPDETLVRVVAKCTPVTSKKAQAKERGR
jgi:hypothetical protein